VLSDQVRAFEQLEELVQRQPAEVGQELTRPARERAPRVRRRARRLTDHDRPGDHQHPPLEHRTSKIFAHITIIPQKRVSATQSAIARVTVSSMTRLRFVSTERIMWS
jgi:hypothetical protein